MMNEGTGEGPREVQASVRMAAEEMAELRQVAEQTGWPVGGLLRLGARNLLREVRETGRLPLPKVELEGGEAA